MSQRSFHALLCNPLCAFVKHGAGFCFARIHLRGPHITRAGEAPPCPHSSAPRVAGRFAVYNHRSPCGFVARPTQSLPL